MSDNPFPLEIQQKQDSWARTQLLLNVASEFKLTAEEFNRMVRGIEYNYNNQGGVYNALPPLESPDYADVAAMYANQANQTQGYMQKVLDGPGDLEVTYYLYKGTLNGDASDYDQLTPEQASVFEGSMAWQTKRISAKGSAIINLTLDSNSMAILTNSPVITGFIFDSTYSKYLVKAKLLFNAGEPIYFSFANATRSTNIVAKVSGFSFYESTDYVIASIETTGNYAVSFNALQQSDILHLFLPRIGGVSGGGAGADGKSAYEIYVETTADDPVLTEAEWLASLKGEKGDKGDKGDTGDTGDDGEKGDTGDTGDTGKSAYQSALDSGFVGTEAQWIASFTEQSVQLALTATGTLTVDFSTYDIADIVLTGDTTIAVTAPTLLTAKSITTLMLIEPDGNAPSVTTDITDSMLGDFDDLTVKYRLVTTWIRRDGSTLVNTSTLTPQE